ncbi:MAG: hypothetical protein V2A77_01010 [Pseudomonadota bacterium]
MKTARSLLVVFLLALLLPSLAEATAYTSNVAAGNWNTAATWTPEGIPTTGDTLTLAAGAEITVPAGYSATSSTITWTAGTTGDHTRLVNNGTLVAGGATTLKNYCDYLGGPGSSLDLNGQTWTLGDGGVVYCGFDLQGSATSYAEVKSSVAGGGITAATNERGSLDWDYFTVHDLGANSTFSYYMTTGQSAILANGVFANNYDLNFYSSSTASSCPVSFTNIDFRDAVGTNKYLLNISCSAPTGGAARSVTNCTFSSTNKAVVRAAGTGAYLDFLGCVRGNVTLTGPHNITSDMSYGSGWASAATDYAPLGGGTVSGSYGYYAYNNPHPILPVATSGGKISFTNNVWEVNVPEPATGTDSGEVISFTTLTQDVDVTGNVLLDTGAATPTYSAVLFNSLNTTYPGLATISRNTVYTNNAGGNYGNLVKTESNGILASAVCKNNLVVKRNASSTSAGVSLHLTTANQIAYADHNDMYNLADAYYHVAITGKTEGVDTGFAAHDLAVDPSFYAPTRNLATWGTSVGADGTPAGAVAKLLLMNGYDATTKTQLVANQSGVTSAGLVSWVRTGFAPKARVLKTAADDGGYVGAMTCVGGITAPIRVLRARRNRP